MAEATQSPGPRLRKLSRRELLVALLRSGILDHNSGALDRAIRRFSKALAIAPHNPAGYIFRGSAWAKKGDLQRAIADYNTAIKLDFSCAEGYYRRAKAWQKLGLYSRSHIDFQKAADLNADYRRRPGAAHNA